MIGIDLLGIIGVLGSRIQTLLALIVVDVVIGVGLAIKRGEFRWRELARFYQTNVIPLLVGWVGFAVLVKLGVSSEMGDWGYLASEGVVTGAWLAAVGKVVSSVLGNVRELYGEVFLREGSDGG